MNDLQQKLTKLAEQIGPLQSEGKLPAGSWEVVLEAVNEIGRLETKFISAQVSETFNNLKHTLDNWSGVEVATGDPVARKVKELIAEQMGVSPKELDLDTKYSDLNLDSLDSVELTMEFEDEFQVCITDEDVDELKTIGETIQYLKTNHAAEINEWVREQS